jgi:hypothetical protein
MWALGYIIMWLVVIWCLCAGFMLTFIGSQFQKELGIVGVIMMIIGAVGGWKLYTMINITVAIS